MANVLTKESWLQPPRAREWTRPKRDTKKGIERWGDSARAARARPHDPEFIQQWIAQVNYATNTEAVFRKLADEWSSEVGNVSSVTALTSHRKYQEIIDLGWDVIPYLLADLQKKRGFWFPALNKITGIRPFDPRDAGNITRMTQAWIQWGKDKRII